MEPFVDLVDLISRHTQIVSDILNNAEYEINSFNQLPGREHGALVLHCSF